MHLPIQTGKDAAIATLANATLAEIETFAAGLLPTNAHDY